MLLLKIIWLYLDTQKCFIPKKNIKYLYHVPWIALFFSQQMAPWRPNFPHQRLWGNLFVFLHAFSTLLFPHWKTLISIFFYPKEMDWEILFYKASSRTQTKSRWRILGLNSLQISCALWFDEKNGLEFRFEETEIASDILVLDYYY